MSPELFWLVASALLCLLLPTVYLTGRAVTPGALLWAAGNRDTPFDVPAWVRRAERAHANLVENLAPFAVLVLVAQITGRTNAHTALGAALFFWARVAHAAVYVVGIPYLRTLIFVVGTAGELLILAQLLP